MPDDLNLRRSRVTHCDVLLPYQFLSFSFFVVLIIFPVSLALLVLVILLAALVLRHTVSRGDRSVAVAHDIASIPAAPRHRRVQRENSSLRDRLRSGTAMLHEEEAEVANGKVVQAVTCAEGKVN